MLAIPPIAAILTADTLKFAPSVTIYTDGPQPQLESALRSQFGPEVSFDDRKIASLRTNDKADVHAGITLSFAEGEDRVERFVVHKPMVEVDLPFASSLGLKMAPSGEIEVSPPSYRTSVDKVYAAGDCAGQARCVSNAFLMGACVATGIVRDIGAGQRGVAPGGLKLGQREEAAAQDQVGLRELRIEDEACQRANAVSVS
jgi:thioredoxin reductase